MVNKGYAPPLSENWVNPVFGHLTHVAEAVAKWRVVPWAVERGTGEFDHGDGLSTC
jgi:hypothetical protein